MAVFAATASGDGVVTVYDLTAAGCADAVTDRSNPISAVFQIDKTQLRILAGFGMDAVLPGDDIEGAGCNAHFVLSAQTMAGDIHGIAAPGNPKGVLGHDAVTAGTGDGKRTGSIQGQIILGKDDSVNVGIGRRLL